MKAPSIIRRLLICAVASVLPGLSSARANITWLNMAPTPVTPTTTPPTPPVPIPNNSVFLNLPTLGAVTMTYTMPAGLSSGRGSEPGWVSGNVASESWTNHEFLTTIRYSADLPPPPNDQWQVTYTFANPVPAYKLAVGVCGLGRTTSYGVRISTATANRNGVFLGDWAGIPGFGATQVLPFAGGFTLQNSVTGAGGANPWWNTNLAVMQITDANITSLTIALSQIPGDGIGVTIGEFYEGCVPPPANMVLWLPFDEITGNAAYNSRGGADGDLYDGPVLATGTNGPIHLDQYGPPLPLGRLVSNSLRFDGVDDSVKVPSYAGIGIGTGDLTVDAWINRLSDLSNNVRVIVDHHEETGGVSRGYALFLQGQTLRFHIADGLGNGGIYTSSFNVPSDNQWRHLAVTVKRNDPTGIRFYLDGAVDLNVQPGTAALTGSLTPGPAVPFRVGAGSQSLAPGFFKGNIDEVEVFRRALSATEINALWRAWTHGKCKVACSLNWDTSVCDKPFDQLVPVQGKIKNASPNTVTVIYSFSGLPPSAGCTLPGPTVFNPPFGNVTINPGQTVCVPTVVTVPPTGTGQTRCYQMTAYVVNGDGDTFHGQGSFQGVACEGPRFVTDVGVLATVEQATAVARWQVTNPGTAAILVPWHVVAYDPDMEPVTNIGFPGENHGMLVLAPGGSVELAVPFSFLDFDPERFYSLVLIANMQAVSSVTLLQTQPRPPDPELSFTSSEPNLVFSFPSLIGRVYTLLESETLTEDSWHTLTGVIPLEGDGGILTITVPHPRVGFHRFFRLKRELH